MKMGLLVQKYIRIILEKYLGILKAIIITLYRVCISHKHLLEWTTSEEAEKQAKTDIFSYYKNMIINVIFGIISLVLCVKCQSILAFILGIIWIITPFIMYYISKEKEEKKPVEVLTQNEKDYILQVGRKIFN